MKKIVVGFILMMSSIVFSQEIYQVIAQEGLTVRTSPNGKRIGKFRMVILLKFQKKVKRLQLKIMGKQKVETG